MRFVLPLLFVAAPLLEIGLLIKVGQLLGFWWTLAVVVGTGALGSLVLVDKGFTAPLKMQEAMQRGEAPLASMLDSALTAMAGVLLILPGLICDTIGLLLLVPPLRRQIARYAVKSFFSIEGMAKPANDTGPERPAGFGRDRGRDSPGPDHPGPRPRSPASGPVIEGDFEVVEEHTVERGRRKPDAPDRT